MWACVPRFGAAAMDSKTIYVYSSTYTIVTMRNYSKQRQAIHSRTFSLLLTRASNLAMCVAIISLTTRRRRQCRTSARPSTSCIFHFYGNEIIYANATCARVCIMLALQGLGNGSAHASLVFTGDLIRISVDKLHIVADVNEILARVFNEMYTNSVSTFEGTGARLRMQENGIRSPIHLNRTHHCRVV